MLQVIKYRPLSLHMVLSCKMTPLPNPPKHHADTAACSDKNQRHLARFRTMTAASSMWLGKMHFPHATCAACRRQRMRTKGNRKKVGIKFGFETTTTTTEDLDRTMEHRAGRTQVTRDRLHTWRPMYNYLAWYLVLCTGNDHACGGL